MASKSEAHRDSIIGAEILSRATVEQHQLESILSPDRPTTEIVGLSAEFVGRPISTWSKEPELARMINDRLSRAVHVGIA